MHAHAQAQNTDHLRPILEIVAGRLHSAIIQVDEGQISERPVFRGQKTTDRISRVAQHINQDDATSHGIARSQKKGCVCPSRGLRIDAGQ
jgi:hypothetical protein